MQSEYYILHDNSLGSTMKTLAKTIQRQILSFLQTADLYILQRFHHTQRTKLSTYSVIMHLFLLHLASAVLVLKITNISSILWFAAMKIRRRVAPLSHLMRDLGTKR